MGIVGVDGKAERLALQLACPLWVNSDQLSFANTMLEARATADISLTPVDAREAPETDVNSSYDHTWTTKSAFAKLTACQRELTLL